ncbi:hypothetical protein SNEBB_010359 [Seison nebaliae]|nr:hypothetical protein SNEBB_010359 [Seison nebaliae]
MFDLNMFVEIDTDGLNQPINILALQMLNDYLYKTPNGKHQKQQTLNITRFLETKPPYINFDQSINWSTLNIILITINSALIILIVTLIVIILLLRWKFYRSLK